MFTEKAQTIIDLAKDYAYSRGSEELDLKAMVGVLGHQPEPGMLLAECFGIEPARLREACPELDGAVVCPGKLPLAEPVRQLLNDAKSLSQDVPDRFRPGLIDVRHLVGAAACSGEVCALLKLTPITREDAAARLAAWQERDAEAPRLEELTERLRRLRTALLARVFGQDHAIHAFVEALFNAEVVAAADTQRKRPRAIFVFAGPPGVGKTYLAELGASYLDRPFKRFDMSAYSGHHQNEALVGSNKNYKGSHPGQLTEFVAENPTAVLLFDEIEKAHTNTIHLFLQILDAGRLEDKYHEQDVAFRNTTMIFTTNVGRQLYDKPNASGVHSANAAFHRKTILDSLENEKDPRTGEPFFPAALCSRMATGYPVMFNHLRINELQRVVAAELKRVGGLLELQYYKQVTFDELLALCLVLCEGARADARTLCSQAGIFVKTEMFKFCQLFKTERLEDVFQQVDRIHYGLDGKPSDFEPDVAALFEQQERSLVLMIADADLANLYREFVTEVDWLFAETADDALELLAEQEVDMVLLDLWIGRTTTGPSVSIQQFDHTPAAARQLGQGQELLRKIRDRLPEIPVYLLSLSELDDEQADHGSIDEELFLACVRGGGARGMIVSRFVDGMVKGWEGQRDQLAHRLVETCRRLHRERSADRMGQERKVLSFDSVPRIDPENRELAIRLRNLRFGRAIAAADAGEVLDDVERPRTKFDEVIGAEAAKEELKFFIDFLKNPKRFSALGLKPPKGVLLYGPPGTGKTMLARAMAGESEVAFISASGSTFVTLWQGSGPQNIRDLFARARRYAPAIIFIDEIDAIGKARSGFAGNKAEENTLNALLTEMDGFTSPSANRPVFVLAATNADVEESEEGASGGSQTKLDPALKRRFSRTVLVDLPNRAARQKYLDMRLNDRPACSASDQGIDRLAERSAGMSVADLELMIEAAARNAAKSETQMSDELLEEAFESIRCAEARGKVEAMEMERPKTNFDEIIGAEAAKEELKFFVDYLKNPERFSALGLRPPKGVLLYGPPGTGKTKLARAMAGESEVAFMPTTGNNFQSKWHGEGEKAIRELFARARRFATAIIFIDEIDAIGAERTGNSTDSVVTQLLTEMDGFASPAVDRPVFVLAATNAAVDDNEDSPGRSQRKLDPALTRRFDNRIEVGLPGRSARQQYLTMACRSEVVTRSFETRASMTASRCWRFSSRRFRVRSISVFNIPPAALFTSR